MLLGVPNFSEGRDEGRVELITAQFSRGAELLDRHSDGTHNRTVLNLTATPKLLGEALVRGAGACSVMIDMRRHEGAHPCIGALDVCPLVYTTGAEHEAARRTALDVARGIGSEGIPVFLYGELATADERRERAYFRHGGLAALGGRMASEDLAPDYGPTKPHPSAGATLVTARPPLAAFNVLLMDADPEAARAIAASLRESGGGLPGVRAIAVDLGAAGMQISTNVHDPIALPLADVIGRIRELGGVPVHGEVVGLLPEAALVGFPEDVSLPGFDRERRVIERLGR